MLPRIVLALLLVAFALPAAAAPAPQGAQAIATVIVHHHPDRDVPPCHEAAGAHLCAGCIPPSNWTGAGIAEPGRAAPPAPAGGLMRLDLGRGVAPALRPPRIG